MRDAVVCCFPGHECRNYRFVELVSAVNLYAILYLLGDHGVCASTPSEIPTPQLLDQPYLHVTVSQSCSDNSSSQGVVKLWLHPSCVNNYIA